MKCYKFLLLLVIGFTSFFCALSCKKAPPKDEDRIEQSVTLNLQSANLYIGDELLLIPQFGLDGIPNMTYHWSVDNSEVVDIDVNEDYSARVIAKMEGSSKVTLSSAEGKQTAVCDIIVENTINDGVIRILAIGNSFSEDAVENYLYDLSKAAGIEVVIGNLYIGGASLAVHWQNADDNNEAYAYRKITQEGDKLNVANTSISTALADERWNYISFQQASPNSGQYNTFESTLPLLFNYVKQRATHPNVKYILHQTWAYAQNSTHTGFANYDHDQLKMYTAIVDAVDQAKGLVEIDLVVPSGTAIQNGRTSVIGDNFCRDGYHLDLNIGRYTAAATWFEAVFGKNVVGNPYKPVTLSDYEAEIAQHAAHFAILKPNEVSEMLAYKEWEDDGNFIDPIFIDFGQSTFVEGWNGLTSPLAGTSIPNLRDKNGGVTGVSLEVIERFNGRNTNGEKVTNTDFEMPEIVASNSYFGNPKGEWSALVIEKSLIKLSGLDKDKTYELCFYGSRSNSGNENRETVYISKGRNEVTTHLDAANNTSETACADRVQPDDNGEITVTITAGKNNNNAYGFYYITAMRISPSD